MKRVVLLFASVIFASMALMAQPPKGTAKKGCHYGQTVSAKDAIPVDDLAAALAGKESAEVVVKGKIANVCESRGCFVYLKTATGKIYVKTKDDAFFVPLSLKGKTVVVKGTASADKQTNELSIQADGILVIG